MSCQILVDVIWSGRSDESLGRCRCRARSRQTSRPRRTSSRSHSRPRAESSCRSRSPSRSHSRTRAHSACRSSSPVEDPHEEDHRADGDVVVSRGDVRTSQRPSHASFAHACDRETGRASPRQLQSSALHSCLRESSASGGEEDCGGRSTVSASRPSREKSNTYLEAEDSTVEPSSLEHRFTDEVDQPICRQFRRSTGGRGGSAMHSEIWVSPGSQCDPNIADACENTSDSRCPVVSRGGTFLGSVREEPCEGSDMSLSASEEAAQTRIVSAREQRHSRGVVDQGEVTMSTAERGRWSSTSAWDPVALSRQEMMCDSDARTSQFQGRASKNVCHFDEELLVSDHDEPRELSRPEDVSSRGFRHESCVQHEVDSPRPINVGRSSQRESRLSHMGQPVSNSVRVSVNSRPSRTSYLQECEAPARDGNQGAQRRLADSRSSKAQGLASRSVCRYDEDVPASDQDDFHGSRYADEVASMSRRSRLDSCSPDGMESGDPPHPNTLRRASLFGSRPSHKEPPEEMECGGEIADSVRVSVNSGRSRASAPHASDVLAGTGDEGQGRSSCNSRFIDDTQMKEGGHVRRSHVDSRDLVMSERVEVCEEDEDCDPPRQLEGRESRGGRRSTATMINDNGCGSRRASQGQQERSLVAGDRCSSSMRNVQDFRVTEPRQSGTQSVRSSHSRSAHVHDDVQGQRDERYGRAEISVSCVVRSPRDRWQEANAETASSSSVEEEEYWDPSVEEELNSEEFREGSKSRWAADAVVHGGNLQRPSKGRSEMGLDRSLGVAEDRGTESRCGDRISQRDGQRDGEIRATRSALRQESSRVGPVRISVPDECGGEARSSARFRRQTSFRH